jgi:HEAT repeat protein
MSDLARWLKVGDLRTDGAANQVVDLVLREPRLLEDLVEALQSPDASTRGHAADALEKIARHRPRQVASHLRIILQALESDKVAMVRWHMAMILGHLSHQARLISRLAPALIRATGDASVFCQSWAVTSLCMIARRSPAWSGPIAEAIAPLLRSSSTALRARARRALALMTDPDLPFPKGWIKAAHWKDGGGDT